jgi:hypothetical protein
MSWTITPQTKVPVDPFRSQVSLLLHGNGTNGSTTITDNSPSPKTVTAVGNAQISTAQSKFGGASIAFDGTGDYLTVPAQDAFNFANNDFTLETHIRVANTSGFKSIIAIAYDNSGGGLFFGLAGSTLSLYGINGSTLVASGGDITADVWAYIALTKSSGVYRIWLNGANTATSTTNNTAIILNNSVSIGAGFAGAFPFNGYIDDLRITKGIARYTANFTPPAAPFPDI